MTEFKLVEYNPKYAKAIADMWNVSKDGWNGEADHKTEESVKRKEEISSHLNLYLALDGDKVIGYCKLSKYFAEENTLYVDLLNVDPAYHGKKAGKMLVKKSVERTIELGYPRIDLFTWAGNTKAVPMYKKCGFFWEQMEGGSTHLMNFIPTVVQAELFRDFFKKADWYDDSNRKIELTPDGVSENGFDYLTYSWQKDGKNLLVEFEKTGRG
ncbi:TPA: GNAT family N-acetyltransferase, partial [Candidatus Delongbacteria bacterium]|nr:GNAT family N-acetyltransferase [Candidatus Delongbacteria bacterium]